MAKRKLVWQDMRALSAHTFTVFVEGVPKGIVFFLDEPAHWVGYVEGKSPAHCQCRTCEDAKQAVERMLEA